MALVSFLSGSDLSRFVLVQLVRELDFFTLSLMMGTVLASSLLLAQTIKMYFYFSKALEGFVLIKKEASGNVSIKDLEQLNTQKLSPAALYFLNELVTGLKDTQSHPVASWSGAAMHQPAVKSDGFLCAKTSQAATVWYLDALVERLKSLFRMVHGVALLTAITHAIIVVLRKGLALDQQALIGIGFFSLLISFIVLCAMILASLFLQGIYSAKAAVLLEIKRILCRLARLID